MSKKEKRAMTIINRDDSTFDRILANFRNPEAFPLTPTEDAIRERWDEAFVLMLNRWPKKKIVERWANKKGIKSSQAYSDIRSAEMIFGNVLKADKEGLRARILIWAEEDYLEYKQKGDAANANKSLAIMAKYGELDKDDNELDTSALTEKTVFTISEKKLRKALESFTKGGVQNFNNLNVIDIESEEIDDRSSEGN